MKNVAALVGGAWKSSGDTTMGGTEVGGLRFGTSMTKALR